MRPGRAGTRGHEVVRALGDAGSTPRLGWDRSAGLSDSASRWQSGRAARAAAPRGVGRRLTAERAARAFCRTHSAWPELRQLRAIYRRGAHLGDRPQRSRRGRRRSSASMASPTGARSGSSPKIVAPERSPGDLGTKKVRGDAGVRNMILRRSGCGPKCPRAGEGLRLVGERPSRGVQVSPAKSLPYSPGRPVVSCVVSTPGRGPGAKDATWSPNTGTRQRGGATSGAACSSRSRPRQHADSGCAGFRCLHVRVAASPRSPIQSSNGHAPSVVATTAASAIIAAAKAQRLTASATAYGGIAFPDPTWAAVAPAYGTEGTALRQLLTVRTRSGADIGSGQPVPRPERRGGRGRGSDSIEGPGPAPSAGTGTRGCGGARERHGAAGLGWSGASGRGRVRRACGGRTSARVASPDRGAAPPVRTVRLGRHERWRRRRRGHRIGGGSRAPEPRRAAGQCAAAGAIGSCPYSGGGGGIGPSPEHAWNENRSYRVHVSAAPGRVHRRRRSTWPGGHMLYRAGAVVRRCRRRTLWGKIRSG